MIATTEPPLTREQRSTQALIDFMIANPDVGIP